MLRTIIIDDEERSRDSLRNLLGRYCEGVEVVADAASAENGLEAIRTHRPDLIFLDIEMPFRTGFDMLEEAGDISFDVIFVTAYDHYAIKAIRFSALDYILKPVDIDELRAAVEKASRKKKEDSGERLRLLLANLRSDGKARKVAIPEGDGLRFVPIRDIIRCESDGNYTTFHLAGGKRLVATRQLGEYENLLSGDGFIRVHRSHLINLDHVQRYIKGEGGFVVMQDGIQVEVSRRKKAEFLSKIG